MKVKDLIEMLKETDQEAEIVLWNWNAGNEIYSFVQPIIEADRFENIFVLNAELRYYDQPKLKIRTGKRAKATA